MNQDTTTKVNTYVEGHDSFNQADWNTVKATIPQTEQEEAEAKVRTALKA